MPVIYNGSAIIPAPFYAIKKSFQKTDDGTIIGSLYSITLQGKLVPHKGSPNSSGVFWTAPDYPPDEDVPSTAILASLLRKQEALRTLFSEEGKTLEITPWNGAAPQVCNPRVIDVEFPNGPWTSQCDYTISLEADVVEGLYEVGDEADYHISKASEEWNIEQADDKGVTFRLTHNVSAVGKRFYGPDGTLLKPAWEAARDYCLNEIGLGLNPDRMVASGIMDGDTLQAFNYVRSTNTSELGGTASIQETWLCMDPQGEAPAVEDWTVDTRTSEDGRTTASIQGTITGLEVRNNNTHDLTSTRYANASSKWTDSVSPALFTRAQTYSGMTLNSVPVGTQVGKNPIAGTISYSYEYNNRPDPSVVGALSESVRLSFSNAADIYAAIPVLGRAAGPVLQSIGTISARKKSVSIEIVMPSKSQTYSPTMPDTNTLVASNYPDATQLFVDQDEESWDPYTGRYSRNVTFTWQ